MKREQVNSEQTASVKVQVVNVLGLHARAAAKIVEAARVHQAVICLSKDGRKAECDSVLSILTLDAPLGSEVLIEASGDRAEEAAAAMAGLFARRFGEAE